MASRLTGLIDMVSRTQDVSDVAFSALAPPSARSVDAAHEEKLKKGHFLGAGLGVALQAHLREREFRTRLEEDSTSKVVQTASEPEDEEKGKQRVSMPTKMARKSGVELPSGVLRLLDHHRKKGIARQEAYLNESVLDAESGGSRPSRSSIWKSRRNTPGHEQRNSSSRASHHHAHDAGADHHGETWNRSREARERRMTASRLIANSIIVGAPKGCITASRGSADHSPREGTAASRLAVQAAGTANCTFFSPQHWLANPEPEQHQSALPQNHDEEHQDHNQRAARGSGRVSASSKAVALLKKESRLSKAGKLLKKFSTKGPNPVRSRASRAAQSIIKVSSGNDSRTSRQSVVANIHEQRSSTGDLPEGQSATGLEAMQWPAFDGQDDNVLPDAYQRLAEIEEDEASMPPAVGDLAGKTIRSSLQQMPGLLSLPEAEDEEEHGDDPDYISRSTAATSSPSPLASAQKRASGLVSPGSKPKALEDLFSSVVKAGETSPEAEPSSPASPKSPLLVIGDKQPLQRKGVRLTITPFNFKVMISRSNKVRTMKPPPPLEYPAPAPASPTCTGESESSKKRPKFVRPRRISQCEVWKVPLKLIGWTSQRDNERHAACNLVGGKPGSLWESVGASDQSLTFDIGCELEVCGLVLRCLGTKADPRDVTLLRSAGVDGPWIIVRRAFVRAGPQNRDKRRHQFLFEPGGPAQYYRLTVHSNWGAAQHVSIFAPLELLSVQKDDERSSLDCDVLPEAIRAPRVEDATGRRSLTLLFNENLNLSKEDRDVRNAARKHGIPLNWAELVRDEFRKFVPGSELFYQEFAKIVSSLLAQRNKNREACAGVHNSATSNFIPEARLRHLWNECDLRNTGKVDFEEFLVWFHAMFYTETRSRQAATVNERFYASMGRERLRQAVHKQELRHKRLQEESAQ